MFRDENFFDLQRFANIFNENSNSLVSGTSGNDSIYNYNASDVTINADAGNDTIEGYYAARSTIDADAGNDSIYAYDNDYVTVVAGAGNDTVEGNYYDSKIYGGDGNDMLTGNYFWDSSVVDGGNGADTIVAQGGSVNGGAGNDSINVLNNYGYSITVKGGTGNDTIIGSANSTVGTLYQYTSGDGNDVVYGFTSYDTISLGGDNYTRETVGSDVVLYVGTGSISLIGASNETINVVGGNLINSIYNSVNNTVVNGTGDNDSIKNDGNYVTINAAEGNDSVYNNGNYMRVSLGTGNDSVLNFGNKVTMLGGAGNDTLKNDRAKDGADSVSVDGGAGNDFIKNFGNYSTLRGGDGADTIGNYKRGYSNDTIAFDNAGKKVKIYAGAGNDSVRNTSSYVTIDGGAGSDSITNDKADDSADNVSVNAGTGNDFIRNFGNYSTLRGGDGNDTIANYKRGYSNGVLAFDDAGKNVKIYGGAGNDSIRNNGSYVTIEGGDGADTITNEKIDDSGEKVSINGGAGKDYITNYGVRVTLYGGKDNDSIKNNGSNVTIDGGADNDYITLDTSARNNVIKFSADSGNDTIAGFNATSTLKIGNGTGTYSSTKSGDDIIVTVGTSKVTLVGAATLSAVNISGQKPDTNDWKLDDTTATYGTTSNTLITVKGVTSLDGISLSGKAVTVSKAALGASNVSITGTGYTLKLGDDVATSATKTDGSFTKISSGTATFNTSSSTDFYTLKNNKITYTAAKASKEIKIGGLKSTATLATVKKAITVTEKSSGVCTITFTNANVLTTKDPTITAPKGLTYTVAVTDNLSDASTTTAWTVSGTNATLKSTTSATYAVKSNKVVYTAKKVVTQAELSGLAKGVKAASIALPAEKILTLDTAVLGTTTSLKSNGGNYSIKLAGNMEGKTFVGTSGADKISIAGTNAKISAGGGDDSISLTGGGNVFVYAAGDGNDIITNFADADTLSIKSAAKYSVNGSDVVFTVGNGNITLKDAKDKTFTYYDSVGAHEYSPTSTEPYIIGNNGKYISLLSSYSETDFDLTSDAITGASKIVTIDASAVTHNLNITGNGKGNLIIGGSGNDTLEGDAGNDTLKGGAGKDVFLYYDGCGKDVVNDYDQKDDDIVQIGRGKIDTDKPSGKDIILKTENGSITVKKAATQGFTYIDEDDIEHDLYKGKSVVSVTNKTLVVTENYWKTSLDANNFGTIKIINAQEVTHDLAITGNAKNNVIYGGSGSNTYIYNNGDGYDEIKGFGSSDIVSIKGARVDATEVIENTVIFTVGKGKISLGGAAGYGKDVTWYDNDGPHTESFAPEVEPHEDLWFMEDVDNFIDDDDNQLSSIVRDGKTSYSLLQTDSLTLTPKNDSLPALTFSDKK